MPLVAGSARGANALLCVFGAICRSACADMVPDVAWKDIAKHTAAGDLALAQESANCLGEWLNKGGFFPAREPYTRSGQAWHEYVWSIIDFVSSLEIGE